MKPVPSPEVFLSKELDSLLKSNPQSKLAKWIKDMSVVLKENKLAGEQIGKSRIPQHYIKKYGVWNLYRYDHPEGYRSCYTILKKCPHILDIVPHPVYDKIFGYKTT